jgi:Niemann-Pick C1 protein
LGACSRIPAVTWLCIYAVVTILFDFCFQITFFIALIVIDEQRMKDKRRDCFVCCTVASRLEDDEIKYPEPKTTISDRFMVWYGDFLLRRWVKTFVIIAFTALFAGCVYSAT